MKSYFKNWFKSYPHAVKTDLSESFAANIHGTEKRIEMRFEQPLGKKIVFVLNESDTANFIRQFKEILNKPQL